MPANVLTSISCCGEFECQKVHDVCAKHHIVLSLKYTLILCSEGGIEVTGKGWLRTYWVCPEPGRPRSPRRSPRRSSGHSPGRSPSSSLSPERGPAVPPEHGGSRSVSSCAYNTTTVGLIWSHDSNLSSRQVTITGDKLKTQDQGEWPQKGPRRRPVERLSSSLDL